MLNIASKSKPPFVCIVPEKRKEITTEGGLNIKENQIDFESLKDNDFLKEKNKLNKLEILFKKIEK